MPYDISFDLLGVAGSIATQQSCLIYIYHDTLTTNNLILRSAAYYNRGTAPSWKTYGASYTPTSSSVLVGFYVSCASSYTTNGLKLYMDNAIAKGEAHHFPSRYSMGLESSTAVIRQ